MGSWFAFCDNGGVDRPETVLPVSREALRSGAGWRVRGVLATVVVNDVCCGGGAYDRDDGLGLYNLGWL